MKKNIIIITIVIFIIGLILTFCAPVEDACVNWWDLCKDTGLNHYDSYEDFYPTCENHMSTISNSEIRCVRDATTCDNIYNCWNTGEEE
jgi:hypothetical protein